MWPPVAAFPRFIPARSLRDDFLRPLGLSVYRLAQELRIPRPRVNNIVRGQRRVTTDTALRLARYFGTTPEFWIRLQIRYDLDHAEPARREIEREIEPRGRASQLTGEEVGFVTSAVHSSR